MGVRVQSDAFPCPARVVAGQRFLAQVCHSFRRILSITYLTAATDCLRLASVTAFAPYSPFTQRRATFGRICSVRNGSYAFSQLDIPSAGCVAFVGVAIWFLSRPSEEVQWEDKLVFSAFFAGAILCLGMSSAFHTVSCHSHSVTKLFSKCIGVPYSFPNMTIRRLDYCGISLLIVGSFIPWLYYGFYCRLAPKLIYMVRAIRVYYTPMSTLYLCR